jgi:uncharacterized coiled-coil protein SlyX
MRLAKITITATVTATATATARARTRARAMANKLIRRSQRSQIESPALETIQTKG